MSGEGGSVGPGVAKCRQARGKKGAKMVRIVFLYSEGVVGGSRVKSYYWRYMRYKLR